MHANTQHLKLLPTTKTIYLIQMVNELVSFILILGVFHLIFKSFMQCEEIVITFWDILFYGATIFFFLDYNCLG
jgi:hypothetical protein